MTATVKCPTCRRPVEWSEQSAYRPFCSERCRLIDMGAWLTEQHKIPDGDADPTDDEASAGDGRGAQARGEPS
jgi:uncharacterized protein